MAVMGLDDSFKFRLEAHIRERDISVNALAAKAEVTESSIRAILKNPNHSTRLVTVEKLAAGLKISPAELLGLEQSPLNSGLLLAVMERLLRSIAADPKDAPLLARSVLRAYEDGIETGVNPDDPRDVEKVVRSEERQLRASMTAPKAAK